MEVTVRFIGVFRAVSERSNLTINLEDAVHVREAVERILEKLPELKKTSMGPRPKDAELHTLILLNGREISVLNGLDTILQDGDEIVFIPVSHGG